MSVQSEVFVVLYQVAKNLSFFSMTNNQEAAMLQLDQFGNIISWNDIIPARTQQHGIPIGGARFYAPYHGVPDIDDMNWKGIVATEQNHLKHGQRYLQKMTMEESSGRKQYHFQFDSSPNYPWKYSAIISAKEFSRGSDGSYGLSYDLAVANQGSPSTERNMPYRVAMQTYFELKDDSFELSVDGKAVMNEAEFCLGSMVFWPLSGNSDSVKLKTGNRTIYIGTMGADHVMLYSNDLTHICIELIYGEKHGKSLAPRESHQLMCRLIVSHD